MSVNSAKVVSLNELCKLVRGKRVLLELPEGLRHILPSLLLMLEDECDAYVFTRLEPCYGGCDIGFDHVIRLSIDVVIHLGHGKYPNVNITGVPVYHVLELEALKPKCDVEYLVDRIERIVERSGCRRVAIGYVEYLEQFVRKFVEIFKRYTGIEIVAAKPILGCMFNNLDLLNVDCYLVVSGGLFHALGLGLATHAARTIVNCDVFTCRVGIVNDEVERVLQARYALCMKAFNTKRWGVVVGVKPGQYRPGIVERIVKAASRRNIRVRLLSSNRLVKSDLDSIPEEVAEVFVITSCPRLAIEDLSSYWRPVLTPGEALYVLGEYSRVKYPW